MELGKKLRNFCAHPVHLNSEVNHHWAWIALGLGALGAAGKNQSRAVLREHVSLADGHQTLSRTTGSGEVLTVIQTACR